MADSIRLRVEFKFIGGISVTLQQTQETCSDIKGGSFQNKKGGGKKGKESKLVHSSYI